MATDSITMAIAVSTPPGKVSTGPAAVSKLGSDFKNNPPGDTAMPFAFTQVVIKVSPAMAAAETQGPAVSTGGLWRYFAPGFRYFNDHLRYCDDHCRNNKPPCRYFNDHLRYWGRRVKRVGGQLKRVDGCCCAAIWSCGKAAGGEKNLLGGGEKQRQMVWVK